MATGNRITNHRDVVYIGVPRIRHVFQLKGQDGYFTAYTRSRPVMAIFKETSVARPANSDGPRKIFSIVSGCIPSSRDQTVTHSAYVTSRFSTIVCSPTRRHYSFFLRLVAQWFSINGSLSTIGWRRFFFNCIRRFRISFEMLCSSGSRSPRCLYFFWSQNYHWTKRETRRRKIHIFGSIDWHLRSNRLTIYMFGRLK